MQRTKVSLGRLSVKRTEVVVIILLVERAEMPIFDFSTKGLVEMSILVANMQWAKMPGQQVALFEPIELRLAAVVDRLCGNEAGEEENCLEKLEGLHDDLE